MTKTLLALVAILLATIQPAAAVEPAHGIGSGFIGNDQTLLYSQQIREAVALDQGQLRTRLWFDPYLGNDTTGNGTYSLPYRSFEKMKLACTSYTRCTVKGKSRVFSPLTVELDTSTTRAIGETFYIGETLSWNAAADSGIVLDTYEDGTNWIVVLARTGGTVDPDAADTLAGTNPARSVDVDTVTNTIEPVGIQTVTFTAGATDRANLTSHGFVNGQGPLYFNNVGGALPTLQSGTFTVGTSYYACAVTANDFQIGNSSSCVSVLDLTGTGSGTNSVNYAPATNPFNPDCDRKGSVCIVIESEFPDFPAVIDGNGFHITNSQGGPGGVFSTTDEEVYGGFVLVQNFKCQNIASDCWTNAPGGYAHTIQLNTGALNMRNGSTENRTDATSNNNCYTTHGPGGVQIILNSLQSESRVDDAGGAGACIAPTETNKTIVLNGGPFTSQSVGGSNWARSLSATGGDIVVVNSHLMGGTTVWYGGVLYDITGSSSGRIQLSRVLFQSRFAAPTGQHLALDNDLSSQPIDVYMREVTFAGRGQMLYLDTLVAPVTVTGQEILADNLDYWIATANAAASIRNSTLDLRGVYDDEDAGGSDSNEWFDGSTGYATRASFVSAMSAINSSWSSSAIFGRNSANSGDGADGTDWGTDTATYRCSSSGKCWKAAISEPPYVIDFRSIYSAANDRDETCIPAEILGQKLCGLSLEPVHYGAR